MRPAIRLQILELEGSTKKDVLDGVAQFVQHPMMSLNPFSTLSILPLTNMLSLKAGAHLGLGGNSLELFPTLGFVRSRKERSAWRCTVVTRFCFWP